MSEFAVVGAVLGWLSFVPSCCARRSLLCTYIEDIKHTLLCTPSAHQFPTYIPIPRIAYCELNSPSRPGGAVFCRIGTWWSRWVTWLFVHLFSHSSRATQSLFRTYIEDIKTHTHLYAIHPPPSNLHSYPMDSIHCVKLIISAGGGSVLSCLNLR